MDFNVELLQSIAQNCVSSIVSKNLCADSQMNKKCHVNQRPIEAFRVNKFSFIQFSLKKTRGRDCSLFTAYQIFTIMLDGRSVWSMLRSCIG